MEVNFPCEQYMRNKDRPTTWQSTQIIGLLKTDISVMLCLLIKHEVMIIQQDMIISYAELQKKPMLLISNMKGFLAKHSPKATTSISNRISHSNTI